MTNFERHKKLVSAKLDECNVKAGIRLASSDYSFTACNTDNCNTMQGKTI